MKSAMIYRYSLPMDSGVILRDTRLVVREGLIVEIREGEKYGRGEIAPLPEFSQETWQQAQAQAQTVLGNWLKGINIDWNALYPSVAFGLSVALAQFNKRFPSEGNYNFAPLCTGDPDDLLQKLAHMSNPKVAKIKVGMYEVIRDGMVVNMLLDAVPELSLRLDANRKWSLEKALKFVKYINPTYRQRIAFLEEPCQNPQDSVLFAQETGIHIAWDESLCEKGFKLVAHEYVKAIVIKPMLIGSLGKVQEWVEKAHGLGMEAVISSSLESSFGLNQLAQIAQWLTPDTIPGLDTFDLFKVQLETPWPRCTLPLLALSECEITWQRSA